MPVQQSSTGTPATGATTRVVNVRHERSMLRLSKWLRKSYRPAIEPNIRLTRWSDLSIVVRRADRFVDSAVSSLPTELDLETDGLTGEIATWLSWDRFSPQPESLWSWHLLAARPGPGRDTGLGKPVGRS